MSALSKLPNSPGFTFIKRIAWGLRFYKGLLTSSKRGTVTDKQYDEIAKALMSQTCDSSYKSYDFFDSDNDEEYYPNYKSNSQYHSYHYRHYDQYKKNGKSDSLLSLTSNINDSNRVQIMPHYKIDLDMLENIYITPTASLSLNSVEPSEVRLLLEMCKKIPKTEYHSDSGTPIRWVIVNRVDLNHRYKALKRERITFRLETTAFFGCLVKDTICQSDYLVLSDVIEDRFKNQCKEIVLSSSALTVQPKNKYQAASNNTSGSGFSHDKKLITFNTEERDYYELYKSSSGSSDNSSMVFQPCNDVDISIIEKNNGLYYYKPGFPFRIYNVPEDYRFVL